jgi:hypothetical protein
VIVSPQGTSIQAAHVVDHNLEGAYVNNEMLGVARSFLEVTGCRNPGADCPLVDVVAIDEDANGKVLDTFESVLVLRRYGDGFRQAAAIVDHDWRLSQGTPAAGSSHPDERDHRSATMATIEGFVRAYEAASNAHDKTALAALLCDPFVSVGPQQTVIENGDALGKALAEMYANDRSRGVAKTHMTLIGCRNPQSFCPIVDVSIRHEDARGGIIQSSRIIDVLRSTSDGFQLAAVIIANVSRADLTTKPAS